MEALLIVDVQVAMFEETNPVYRGKELLEKIENLILKARSKRVPIIYIQHITMTMT